MRTANNGSRSTRLDECVLRRGSLREDLIGSSAADGSSVTHQGRGSYHLSTSLAAVAEELIRSVSDGRDAALDSVGNNLVTTVGLPADNDADVSASTELARATLDPIPSSHRSAACSDACAPAKTASIRSAASH